MRAQHMGSGGGESAHPIRNCLIGLFIIVVVLTVAPDLGAQHNPQAPSPNTAAEQDDSNPFATPRNQQIMDWTILRHKGYNDNMQCWVLQLDRSEGPQQETTGDFCAKDKNDYDSHADSAHYQTKGGWLDNLIAPDQRPKSDNA